MVGNASEEGLLGQIKNASHTAWARPAIALCVLTWLGGLVLFTSIDMGLPLLMSVCIVVAAGCLSGRMVYRWGSRYSERRQTAFETQVRAEREAETARQLEEARASGAFDRWNR
ncbi:MAG: hypothetical protein AAF409_04500 [Pseudomonadota bacterium]